MIDWKDKRVLVAGGAGQIGSHLVKRLVDYGAKVVVADNLSSGEKRNLGNYLSKIAFTDVDLRNATASNVFCQGKDYVFQLAANMGGMIYIDKTAKHNVEITGDNALININMLNAAYKASVKGYFYSSSACIYPTYLQREADAASINLKESDDMPADPNEFYGWEKLFTEKLCEAYINDYNFNIHVARFHNVFGECFTSFNKDRGKAPCLMIANVLRYQGGDFTGIWGDGKQTRSFLYVEDCVDGILTLMNSDYHKPINIGSDECVTINQLCETIFKISGKTPDSIFRCMDMPQGVRGRNADLTLVKKELNWSPKLTLYQGLEKVYKWAEAHREDLKNM